MSWTTRMLGEHRIVEHAAYRLMLKFHSETDCGKTDDHWSECEALTDALGYDSFDQWIENEKIIAALEIADVQVRSRP